MHQTLRLSALVAAVGVLASCSTPSGTGPAASARAARTSCADAELSLPEDAVVATLDGAAITMKDLGPELHAAEQKALRTYCESIATARRAALDSHVTEKLVKAAAAKEGVDDSAWVQKQVEAKVPEPSDAEIQAFYDARSKGAPPGAVPPIDQVKPQIVAMLKREKSESVVGELIDGLMKGANLKRQLPDVRPPAIDLKAAAHTATKGPSSAKVKLVEFADFQCPYCSRAAESVRQLVAKYGDKIEVSYRHFPLRQIHPNAQRASEYAQCANEQGKFWEMYDKLYENQQALDEESIKGFAKALGLDEAKLGDCVSSGRGAAQVEIDYKQGESAGIEGTPSFFINGRMFGGNPTVEGLSAAIDEELGS